MTQITQIIGMSATLKKIFEHEFKRIKTNLLSLQKFALICFNLRSKNPIDPLNLRHLRSFVQQTITNRKMKHYKTVQVKIHSVGPLVKGDPGHTHDRRNVSFHRIHDDQVMESFSAYLVGEEAHHATLRLGQLLELTYYSMQDGGKFIVNYQYL